MPVVSIDAGWLTRLLEKEIPPEELGESLDRLGCDVEDVAEIEQFRCPGCQVVIDGASGAAVTRLCPVCGHETEQPFTRSVGGLLIPSDVTEIVVAARDSVAGFCGAEYVAEVPHP